jgi:cleavage stimulation factor subunit 1
MPNEKLSSLNYTGRLVATGSSDTSIKLLDVEKMKNYNQNKLEHGEDFAPARPVIRTFYDHSQPVNDLDFHPFSPILISSSQDYTIKFYDHSQANVKRAFRYIQDSHNVRSINFHPSGDYVLAGTENPVIRLYDVSTFQCFVSSNPQDHHTAAINQVRFSPQGNMFATAAKDGLIKLWDAVNHRVVNTLVKPHGSHEVKHMN